jgi:anti-sigma factor (TIGR02949 family)
MISCSEAVRQLWDYLEREVAPADAQRIEEHLSVCRRCCGEVEFADELRTFLATNAVGDIPGEVEQRLLGFLDGLDEQRLEQQP